MVLTDQLGELRVSGANLLKDRLKHLWLLLDKLTKLLEMWVVAQELQAAQAASTLARTSSGTRSGTSTTATTSATSASLRSSLFEKI